MLDRILGHNLLTEGVPFKYIFGVKNFRTTKWNEQIDGFMEDYWRRYDYDSLLSYTPNANDFVTILHVLQQKSHVTFWTVEGGASMKSETWQDQYYVQVTDEAQLRQKIRAPAQSSRYRVLTETMVLPDAAPIYDPKFGDLPIANTKGRKPSKQKASPAPKAMPKFQMEEMEEKVTSDLLKDSIQTWSEPVSMSLGSAREGFTNSTSTSLRNLALTDEDSSLGSMAGRTEGETPKHEHSGVSNATRSDQQHHSASAGSQSSSGSNNNFAWGKWVSDKDEFTIDGTSTTTTPQDPPDSSSVHEDIEGTISKMSEMSYLDSYSFRDDNDPHDC